MRGGVVRPKYPELETIPGLDVARYMGTWYEIAAIPSSFEKGCHNVMATYTLQPDGKIRVVNSCRKHRLDGPVKQVVGKAWMPDPDEPGKLKVSFFLPWLAADYWILELGRKYEYAVIGSPNRKFFWILNRTPKMDEKLLQSLMQRIEDWHFNARLLRRTLHPKAA
jgi:apolipoprotein D and lipocalin family protein